MLFKVISYLELWWPFCSAERNNLCLCNFGRGYPEEQFYKIILNLDLWFRRICLFVLLLYVPSQQLWSLRDGQFT